jgi:HD-GYP domain-containing protein (c-di-GMP phosphodiesterase class II)/ribonuclease BN (tRNA processing enzyme)
METAEENLRQIFLTHAHLDHVLDLPFLIERHMMRAGRPLLIYGTKMTLELLGRHIFNNRVWPDFRQIPLSNSMRKSLEFIEISMEETISIDGISITPIPNNHTEGSCGYLLKKNHNGILISSDTYLCDSMMEILDKDKEIHAFCVDVSFPSSFGEIARESKHLTPKLLLKELKKIHREDFDIYPVHLKPPYRKEISEELENCGILKGHSRILADGDKIFFSPRKQDCPISIGEEITENPLEEISDASMSLSNENNIDRLLQLILTKAKNLTHSDGGTLYLLNSDKKYLEFKVIQNDSLKIMMGGDSGRQISWDPLPLYTSVGAENMHMAAVAAVFEDRVINIADVYNAKTYDFSGTRKFDEHTGYRSKSMLILPLKNHENSITGVLQLINKTDRCGNVIPFDHHDENIAMILATQAAIVLTKQQFIDDMEKLFESFLQAINVAIESKSKYTAGHIQKMVAITEMIIDAINADTECFREVSFDDDRKKETILAAMMHDVGKIVIPEYVVDKATKLQTIYDRIESVRLKAEIRRHEAETASLQRHCNLHEISDILEKDREYLHTIRKIEEELDLVKWLNHTRDYIDEEKLVLLKEISKNKIRFEKRNINWLNGDEVKNLSIKKGTLTDEERNIINSHAYVGMKMLEKVSFPKKYSRIPEIASAHHEKLDGSGYPLGLKGDEISLESRILAIADIFEALTAADRPYKSSKSVDETMKILETMAEEGALDKKIVGFMRSSGLFREIEKKILHPNASGGESPPPPADRDHGLSDGS